MNKSTTLLLTSALFIFFIFLYTSCKKKETACEAIIQCVDSTGNKIRNVDVLLYATVKNSAGVSYTADVKASGQTDGSGEISFTFKLPAIYDISATLVADTRTITGTNIIKLEEGKTINKTVTLYTKKP